MQMHNPPHPGSILKEDVLPGLGLGVQEAARQLGVSRAALSRVINGRAAVSAEMALRLEAWLDGPTADTWMRMQADYDFVAGAAAARAARGEVGGLGVKIAGFGQVFDGLEDFQYLGQTGVHNGLWRYVHADALGQHSFFHPVFQEHPQGFLFFRGKTHAHLYFMARAP